MLKRKTKWPALISLFSSMLYIACEKEPANIYKKTRTEHNQGSTARWTFIFSRNYNNNNNNNNLHMLYFSLTKWPERLSWCRTEHTAQQKERNNYEEVTRMFFFSFPFPFLLPCPWFSRLMVVQRECVGNLKHYYYYRRVTQWTFKVKLASRTF